MTVAPLRALRTLREHWKVTATAVLSLGTAMALCVASLTISNTFLLLPPAGVEPDRLVTISENAAGTRGQEISFPDYEYFRANNHVFTDIAAAPNSVGINFQSGDSGDIRVISRPLSENYFSVLGIKPLLGRLFAAGDDHAEPRVAVMTYACWKRLGSDPKIVGRQIANYTVVGVAPPEFTGSLYGLNGDLVLSVDADQRSPKREDRHLVLLARLKPGVTRQQAAAEMRLLSTQLASAYPKEDKDRVAEVSRATMLPPESLPDAELAFGILTGVVLLVLLIACANVANLLLAVAVGRRREAALKMALGAQRSRLIGEFLLEGAMLCAAAGALGYMIAATAVKRFSDIKLTVPIYGSYGIGLNLHMSWAVAAGTAALVLIAVLATGLVPALYASSPHLAQFLAGEVVVGGTRKNARRNVLVAVQVAVGTFVLVGTGLGERSLYQLRHVDVGFSARNLVAEPVFVKQEGMSEAQGKAEYEEIRRAVAALPGVQSATLASELPLFGQGQVEVQPPGGDKKIQVRFAAVDSDYFPTLRFRLLAGRVFDSRDHEKSPAVVVINRRMAEMLWPGKEPVGQTVIAGEPARTATVIGVVPDGKYDSLDEDPQPFLYYPLTQQYRALVNVIARTAGDPKLWEQPLARAIQGLGFEAPVQPTTYDAWTGVTILPQRIGTIVVAALSGLGLLLAIIGLAAAVSYSVSERRKELGIRVALGAGRGQLLQMILRQTGMVAGAGVAAGMALGIAAGALLRSQLFGISTLEWTVLVPVAAGVLGLALAVAYLSARPWLNVDPMEAVRHV